MNKYIKNASVISIIAVIILNFYFLRSLLVMYPYNKLNYFKSFIKEEKINVEIPKEKSLDWYPLMNFYRAENFSEFINEDVDLGIYYTFGKFEGKHSDIFRKDSETYSSFYGAYVLKNNENNKYLIDDTKSLIVKDIIDILVYDYKYLVIRPLGYKKELNVEYNILIETKEEIFAELEINGLSHNFSGFNTNYIQYGTNGKYESNEFKKIKTYGKFIVEKPKKDIYIIYYIINNNKEVVERWGIK